MWLAMEDYISVKEAAQEKEKELLWHLKCYALHVKHHHQTP